jgi:hypothetical protein
MGYKITITLAIVNLASSITLITSFYQSHDIVTAAIASFSMGTAIFCGAFGYLGYKINKLESKYKKPTLTS